MARLPYHVMSRLPFHVMARLVRATCRGTIAEKKPT
jgi:hypothetical protein